MRYYLIKKRYLLLSGLKGLTLISYQDIKKFFVPGPSIKFLSKSKITKLVKKNNLKFLIFNGSVDIYKGTDYENLFISISFGDYQKLTKQLNPNLIYLIIGPGREQMEHYRYLRFLRIRVYLHK